MEKMKFITTFQYFKKLNTFLTIRPLISLISKCYVIQVAVILPTVVGPV